MSRTDAHRPYWVDVEWFIPSHHWQCRYNPSRPSEIRSWNETLRAWEWKRNDDPSRPCDLPATPDRKRDWNPWGTHRVCRWRRPYTWDRDWNKRFGHPNGKENRQVCWYGPERSEVRDWCRDEVKRYRGGVESDPMQPDRVRKDLMPWD